MRMIPELDYFTGLQCTQCGACLPDISGFDNTDRCPECLETDSLEDDENGYGIWVRLSAPGYLDATEWSGPFANRFRALRWVVDFYDIDPRTDWQPIEWEKGGQQ